MNAVLEVRHLSKRFGERQALAGVDFALAPGTTTVLLGANGAGKSTLLRAILGLLAPDGGQVRVLGRDPLREPRAVRLATGYAPDQPDAPCRRGNRVTFSGYGLLDLRARTLVPVVPLGSGPTRLLHVRGLQAIVLEDRAHVVRYDVEKGTREVLFALEDIP